MTPLWTAADAAAATGGSSTGSWAATGVSIDTRSLAAGDLFVALRGPNHDGHDFVGAALKGGAAAAMVDREVANLSTAAPLLRVADTLAGLTSLGAAARKRSRARILAVTGSVGKTGTKEALRLALAPCGPTFASAGGLNNHWGAPLSLARMPPDAEYGIFELGMNHSGEITVLAQLARPHVAVITTVEPAHLGFFPSVEAIADAKAEIFLGLEPGGIAVLNRDNPHFARLAAAADAGRCGRGGRLWHPPRGHGPAAQLCSRAWRQHVRRRASGLYPALSPPGARPALGHERARRTRCCNSSRCRPAPRRRGADQARTVAGARSAL